VPTKDVELTGPPIKAVTYHQLQVAETDEGWSATVYFDV
jgi:SHS2 domain-containing protein